MKIISRIAKVDYSKCVGCKSCENHCPTAAIKVQNNASQEEYVSPCRNACPAGVDVPGYVALAGKGAYEDAYRLIRRANPFPSVCGRICTHPCQEACNRGTYDQSVAIRDIKRFVADQVFAGDVVQEEKWPLNGKSVGIIGAGPSGLSCAYYLALSGFAVDVYEQQPVAGGVLAFGIPEYRLPKDVLKQEISVIEKAGVNIHISTEIGKDITFEELREQHDSIYIATGTQFSKKAGIEGENMPGVYHGIDFLRDLNLGTVPEVGEKILIIGGGNTAIDVSRSVRRLGKSDVTILYRRRVQDMPADVREVEEAIEEGVKIRSLAAPVAISGNGKAEKIRCVRMEIGEKDAKGRRSTHPVEGSEFELDVDTVIIAVSQYADFPFVSKEDIEITKWGSLVVNEEMATTMPGVFSGGDVVRGSDTAIAAIADGKKAAVQIAKYLGTPSVNEGAEIILPAKEPYKWNHDDAAKMNCLDPAERVCSNAEVALGLTEEQIKSECSRCMRCSGQAVVDAERCMDCQLCWEYCPHEAITMQPLEQERFVQYPEPDISETETIEEILRICHDAHFYPISALCPCTGVKVSETVHAIVKGAHTVEDVTLKTGARAGCGGMYCFQKITRLLDAAGYPQTAREDGMWYNIPIDIWNVTEEQMNDPQLDLKWMSEQTWNEAAFEATKAMYIKSLEAKNE